MPYQYYNQFNLTNELANSISAIISKKEGTNYICKSIIVTVSDHKGLVFYSPLDNVSFYGGGLKALSGAQIAAINEKYGKWEEGTIPEVGYHFMIIMDIESFEKFSEYTFENKEQIEVALKYYSAYSVKYDGTFDANILCQKFPYLKGFFGRLDDWRAETGRVTLDDSVLERSMKKSLSKKAKVSAKQ